MQHRTLRGRIRYTSRKPGRVGEERGRESFTITRHTDGKVTIRALCEIEEPAPTVLRDVIYSLDENDRPMDCHVRLTVGDRFMGSGWFRMTPEQIECVSYGPTIGRISQVMPVNGHYDGFGTHPIIGDAYMTRCMDVARGPHKRPLRAFLPSPDHRGATPPLVAETNLFLEYVGDETVTVAAGTFDCRHFRFTDENASMASKDGAHPPYDVWVTRDEDSLFVQGGVGGYMLTWYELAELDR
ncbi:hypothetical protein UCD39_05760 [Nitrospirillum sp. BR 11752]|uniref:DUF3108 domain-containing protein n=1 Tax=Nitrospirillum amazonense TaxID=28077 RepID=A0A560HHE3_9PROT|nr:DUF3108 domain-containing protein [Nitrospirillum amazonense]MEE3623494.1 hypothetical protein [Nitrospirillum sp. BR 11752]TWB45877.1 hypothetical protein FBZ90_101212 [Nitrospirillum amazonense]